MNWYSLYRKSRSCWESDILGLFRDGLSRTRRSDLFGLLLLLEEETVDEDSEPESESTLVIRSFLRFFVRPLYLGAAGDRGEVELRNIK